MVRVVEFSPSSDMDLKFVADHFRLRVHFHEEPAPVTIHEHDELHSRPSLNEVPVANESPTEMLRHRHLYEPRTF